MFLKLVPLIISP